MEELESRPVVESVSLELREPEILEERIAPSLYCCGYDISYSIGIIPPSFGINLTPIGACGY